MDDEKQKIDINWLHAGLEGASAPLEPGMEVQITSKWREYDYFFLNVKSPASIDDEEYSLTWLVQIGLESFVVLSYPPPVRAELDEPIYFVLKVIDQRRLQVIPTSKLSLISAECIREMSRISRSEQGRMELVFGTFSTWEEHKATMA